MAVKKSTLYSKIWASCDELRGGMDATEYKDYVLFMLFIKYVSDKYGNSKEFAPAVVIPKGASFKDMIALKGKPNIGERINTEVIQPLVDANTRLARSDFPDFDNSNKLGDGSTKVERIGNLISIFEDTALDFSQNRADNDDILGDAYEYLMRHFARESGKSKGQFYTPSEVSSIIAKVIGISPKTSVASTTVYDPTCGSGSLLLKVAAEAGKPITLEGQEKYDATAGLARMNMILHNFPSAQIESGGDGTLVKPKFLNGEALRTYDYVVANPPFSDKTWSTGLTLGAGGSGDRYQRFTWGVPPKKQGDYAYLLHIIRSMKSTGKAACILPHGVLFRGNDEADIRQELIRSGYLKAIIGLPANLFYGTPIAACILVLDKENAAARKGIFMIDASKGFKKDGPKNRLREQDIHKIVDTFTRQDEGDPRYARVVPVAEIADPKNDYNLNLPRYVFVLGNYWKIMPSLRAALFGKSTRAGYSAIQPTQAEIKPTIFAHPEFTAFTTKAKKLLTKWQAATVPQLKGLAKDGHPKMLIAGIAEDLLATFKTAPLLDAYDVYQHLMDYWAETMQDDCYLIAAEGWKQAAQPQLIALEKGKKSKAKPDFALGKKKYQAELIPPALVIRRFYQDEQALIEKLAAEVASLEQQMEEMAEENGGDEGLLADAANDKGKITKASATTRLKELKGDKAAADEIKLLKEYLALADKGAETSDKLSEAEEALTEKIASRYDKLTEEEIKTLVVEDKWMATLSAAVQGELDRVSQTLTGRIRELAERYATPLPQLTDEVATLAGRVDEHLKKMGAVWK
ncbi:type I restriction endonuclease subunit M [bacterium]|nr:type I restriction endonuclease subunit M [bacterium]